MMKVRNRKSGFTLAEMMITVAIIAILATVAFISVPQYIRVFKQLQYDNVAKEIFISAQNHLSMAYNEGYLDAENTDFGTQEGSTGIYYFIVDQNVDTYKDTVFDQMLPFGSIEESARSSGSYIIRYHKETGQIVDVFYSDPTDATYGHHFVESEYDSLRSLTSDDKKQERRNYVVDNSVLGYYGANETDISYGSEIEAPYLRVENAEQLKAIVKINNLSTSAELKLIVKGLSSKSEAVFTLKASGDVNTGSYDVILDDITNENRHFSNISSFADSVTGSFVPGENLNIYAVASDNTVLTNVATSATIKTNSLFGNDTAGSSIDISNIRHLENLDSVVSNFNINNYSGITEAKQSADLDWDLFKRNINEGSPNSVYITNSDNTAITSASYYYPVNWSKNYDGQKHAISNVSANSTSDAGLFQTLSGNEVSNLELIDFNITGSNAGALAGRMISSAEVTNVLVRENQKTSLIYATNYAGGLVGSSDNSTIRKSAAAVRVNGAIAGGLVARADNSNIISCYSSGHTSDGNYISGRIDVTSRSGEAGGLIGRIVSTSIESSYSTCSVSGSTYAGGLIGRHTGGNISNAYAVGHVVGSETNKTNKGLFIGYDDNSIAYTNCYYLAVANNELDGVYNRPSVSGLSVADKNTSTYREFINNTQTNENGHAYDTYLVTAYKKKYLYKGVLDLNGSVLSDEYVYNHYGDWPTYETFIINQQS